MCHKSPAKILRNVKRMSLFLDKKPNTLSISILPQINIIPLKKPLGISPLITTNVPPQKPKLDFVRAKSISIPPHQIYHPAVINASNAMFGKDPSQLEADEALKFKMYRMNKIQKGEPLETEVIFLPIGGIRTCVNCRELT